ncbi:MAG: glycosyltransferase family 39 protein [Blastocatellia bacterium]
MEQQPAAKHRRLILLALVSLCGVTFFLGLGRVGLWGPDEPRYAEVAREMFAGGDYISPRLCGCLWFEKPALFYWMAAGSYHLLGVCEYAARLPSALAATVTVLGLLWVLWRTGLSRVAVASSLALATTAIFIGFARAATPDMVLTAAVTIALLAGYLWTGASGRSRIVCWVVLSAATGVAVLAKGLVGAALVVPVFVIHLAIIGKLKSIGWRECVGGLAIFLAVVSIWYGPVTARHGWEFLDEFFYKHHIRRYLTNRYHHPAPVYFFPFVALAGAVPWTFFLVPAVSRLRALRPRLRAQDSMLALAWVWVGWPLIFFSFSVTKLPGYLLPVFPALAMIIGAEVERFWSGERERTLKAAAWLTALVLAAISVALIVYTNDELNGTSGWRTGLIWLPAAVATASVLLLAARRPRAFLLATAAVMASAVVSAVVLLLPVVSESETLKSFSLETAAQLQPGERIGFFIKSEYAPVFYSEGRVVCGLGEFDVLNALNEQTLVSALEHDRTLVVITDERWRPEVERFRLLTAKLIGEKGKTLAFRVSLKNRNGEP